MPITWRNVEAPSNADAMRGFQYAGQSITGAFDRLGDMVKASEVFQQGVRDRADEANVLSLKEALQGARTPEDVAKIQGQLSEMRSGLSNKGRTAVLGAEEARVSALQQRLTAENQFKDGLANREQALALRAINFPLEIANAQAAAENAPLVRQLDAAALNDRVALQPITSKTNLTNARNAQRSAAFTANQAGDVENLARMRMVEDRAQMDDAAQGRRIDADVTSFVAANQKKVLDTRTAITAVGLKLPRELVPLKPDGSLALDQMTSDARKGFNAVLASSGLPPVETLESGDTLTKQNLIEELRSKGYSASHIARVAQGLDFSLSNGPTASIGNDKAALEKRSAELMARQQTLERQYGIKAEPGSIGEQLNGGLAAIDSVVAPNSARSEIYKERLGYFLQNGGIKVPGAKGETVRVMPNPDQIRAIVTAIDKKWHNTRIGVFGKSGMQEEIDNALNSWAKSKEALEGATKLVKLDLTSQLQKLRKAEEQPLPLPGVLQGKKK